MRNFATGGLLLTQKLFSILGILIGAQLSASGEAEVVVPQGGRSRDESSEAVMQLFNHDRIHNTIPQSCEVSLSPSLF